MLPRGSALETLDGGGCPIFRANVFVLQMAARQNGAGDKSLSASSHTQRFRTTRILIAGAGSIGRRHCQNLMRLGVRDIAFYRRSAES
jgi:hypothetical protein